MPRLSIGLRLQLLVAILVAAPSPARAVMPTRTGDVPTPVAEAFSTGRFALPVRPELSTSAASGVWKVPVILIDFSDQPLTHSSMADWKKALFDTTGATATGSVTDYYRWVSGNRLKVIGQVVARVRMEQPKAYYAYNAWGLSNSTPQNSAGAVLEALAMSHSLVDWSEYDRDQDGYVDMLWVIHSGLGGENTVSRDNLWSITSKLSAWGGSSIFVTEDVVPGTSVKEKVDGFSILPELSAFRIGQRAEIGVFCHEFGHALGLPDLYDTAPFVPWRNVGPGNWSLMSTGTYGTDGQSPEYPAHVGAWPAAFLGWKQPIRPTRDTLLTLASLGRGGEILELWFQGEPNYEHFLVENRQRDGFDKNLIEEGLIVYQVDDAAIRAGIPSNHVNNGLYPALRVIEADGRQDMMYGWNRGDRSDPLPGLDALTRWDDATTPGSRSIRGNVTHVAMEDVTPVGDDVRFMARVRAKGWQPARSLTGSGFTPVGSNGPAPRAASLADGSLVTVSNELIGGRAQVVFRQRRPDGAWESPVTLSFSPTGANDPSLAVIPGGDVGVIWSDTRHGAGELYYRARIRGVWTQETRLTNLPGTSRKPSLAADLAGGVHAAWLYHEATAIQVRFMYFTYVSPFGDSQPLASGPLADAPAVAASPHGMSYVFWPERGSTPVGLWYARFIPGQGLTAPKRLVSPEAGTLPILGGTVIAGELHALWAVAGVGGTELRYMKVAVGARDTTLLIRGEPFLDFSITPGPQDGLHIVVEAARSGASQILYKQWRSFGGWDVGATELTTLDDGDASRPSIVPRSNGLTVLYVGYPFGGAAIMERDRDLMEPVTAVAPASPPRLAGIRVRPNPVPAGRALHLSGEGAPEGAEIELVDVTGRVVARSEARVSGDGWRAELTASGTVTLPSGIYFARFRGGAARARVVLLR